MVALQIYQISHRCHDKASDDQTTVSQRPSAESRRFDTDASDPIFLTMPSPVPKSPPREPAAGHMPESLLATEAPPFYNVRNADTTTSLAEQLTHPTQASAEVPQQPAAPAAQIEPDPWQRLAQLTDELAPKSARGECRRPIAHTDVAAGAKGRRTLRPCKRRSTSCCRQLVSRPARARSAGSNVPRYRRRKERSQTCVRADQAI